MSPRKMIVMGKVILDLYMTVLTGTCIYLAILPTVSPLTIPQVRDTHIIGIYVSFYSVWGVILEVPQKRGSK